MELFKNVKRKEGYVERWLTQDEIPAIALDENDVLYSVKDRSITVLDIDPSECVISSEKELEDLQELDEFVYLQYDQCLPNAYEKITSLASGRPVVFLESKYEDVREPTVAILNKRCKLFPRNDAFRLQAANPVFIHGGAGEGKTSYLENLAETLHLPNTVVLHTSAPAWFSRLKGNLDKPVVDAIAICCGLNNFETDVIKK